MKNEAVTFALLDIRKGIAPLPDLTTEEMPLPAWYRSVYNTPIEELTVDDLSRACRQGIHLDQVIPLALAQLSVDPLAGEMYDGELVVSLSAIPSAYWIEHSDLASIVKSKLNEIVDELPDDVEGDAKALLLKLA